MSRVTECKRIVEVTIPEVYSYYSMQTVRSVEFQLLFVAPPSPSRVELVARISKGWTEASSPEIDMLNPNTATFLGSLAGKGVGEMGTFGGVDWMFRETQPMTKWQAVLHMQRLAIYEVKLAAECAKLSDFPPS
jgi:hypothetical protein